MLQQRYTEAEPFLVEGYTTLRDGNGPTEAALRRLVAFYAQVDRPEQASTYQALLNDDAR